MTASPNELHMEARVRYDNDAEFHARVHVAVEATLAISDELFRLLEGRDPMPEARKLKRIEYASVIAVALLVDEICRAKHG